MNTHGEVIDGTWAYLNGMIADVPCWTCRRRKLRCDNLKPSCVKCTRAGLKCLGYDSQKPLVWVGRPGRPKKAVKGSKDASPGTGYSIPDLAVAKRIPSLGNRLPSPNEAGVSEYLSYCKFNVLRQPRNRGRSYSINPIAHLDYADEQRCCMECSIYEQGSKNPFRQFLLLRESSPLVHHTIVSLAAHHRARCSTPLSWPRQFTSLPIDATEGEALDDKAPTQLLASKHYADALAHKRQAMQHLQLALSRNDTSDAVVVSTLLLIWVELLESGYKYWRYHLSGMRALLCSRVRSECSSNSDKHGAASDSLGSFGGYFEEAFVVSVRYLQKLDLTTVYSDPTLVEILQRAERRSWAGCPAELLRILCCFNSLSARMASSSDSRTELYEIIASLFDQLDNFSPVRWAGNHPESSQAEQRNHLASAYKIAIEAYGRRAFQVRGVGDMENKVEEAVGHLEKISPEDSHFKGCLWPAFVIGAEARDVSHRLAITSILLNMYDLLQARSVERGLEALERLWRRESQSPGNRSWLDIFYEEGEELLLV
ncbi:C6 finger domain-containing protein [Colletotrichum musicola]|uniref:C6 finger domain-containing protein n=1 Tax=Colletotrichum musicola TaxID=2175873 RepID=A0A8H6K2B6_9PEZI|nr:C6 finger domain-containing protein [Colletotrichum musicola]